jgi:hypothetical protein
MMMELTGPQVPLAIVNLLPPCQSAVHALVISSKWGSFLPMEEVVSDLKVECFQWNNRIIIGKLNIN